MFGLAFKANTDDVRASPAIAIARRLRTLGATVTATDPQAGANAASVDPEAVIVGSPHEAAVGADAVIVVTEWPEFSSLDWGAIAGVMTGRLVLDLRGVVDRDAAQRAGLRLVALGVP